MFEKRPWIAPFERMCLPLYFVSAYKSPRIVAINIGIISVSCALIKFMKDFAKLLDMSLRENYIYEN